MTGKWHLGQMHGTPPRRTRLHAQPLRPDRRTLLPQSKTASRLGTSCSTASVTISTTRSFGKNWYGTDLITDWGLKFIDESIAANKPFFYYLPFCAVHFPLQVPQADIDRYHGKYMVDWQKLREARHKRQIEMGLVDPKWPLSPLAARCARLEHAEP